MNRRTKSAAIRVLERAGGPITFGRLLQAIRLGEDETPAAFARRLGTSRGVVCDIEKGRRCVSIERAALWAKTLGYPAAQFVGLVLQAQVDAAGLRMQVEVTSRQEDT